MDLTGMSITSLNECLKALHHKYIDSEYDVKVSMLCNSMGKSSIGNKPSLADLENEINRVMEEIRSLANGVQSVTGNVASDS